MTDLSSGDYISFTKTVKAPIHDTYRDAAKKAYKVLKQEAEWIEQSGSGQILKINKAPKKLGGEAHRSARVDAGPFMGVVTVSLDDAIIVGVQQLLMDAADYQVSDGLSSMYDTFGGGA